MFPAPNRRTPELRRQESNRGPEAVQGRRARLATHFGKRARGGDRAWRDGFAPPENWHEPRETPAANYRIVVQPAGPGYCHVVTAAEVRARLALLSPSIVERLEVVQFSQMTRKKLRFPCYGMQWGSAVYLYPVEADLVERFCRAPGPAQLTEARMYGGQWERVDRNTWNLHWTEPAIKDFYLNNILIHEVGHLVDDRNSTYADRERFAEWFAIEYGYRASRKTLAAAAVQQARKIVRRHHRSKK